MTKKILIVLVVSLFFVLVGLLVVYLYVNKPETRQNSALTFIPPSTQLIIRIKKTSSTTTEFLQNQMVMESFNISEIMLHWKAIDSITSRNYKTAELMQKNASYLCVDTAGDFLILMDISKRANEHFIDQFLATSTSKRKIDKFKEGYKAFYPRESKPLYYFVRGNVFGIAQSPDLIIQSLQNHQASIVDSSVQSWDEKSVSDISVWGKHFSDSQILANYKTSWDPFGGWLDSLTLNFWFDVDCNNGKIKISGIGNVDTSSIFIKKFAHQETTNDIKFFKSDTGYYNNMFFSLTMLDSLGVPQQLTFVHHYFFDTTSQQFTELLASGSGYAAVLYNQAAHDTSVQIIPMADEKIKQMVVMGKDVLQRICSMVSVNSDTTKFFATILNNQLIIATSTTSVLALTNGYPDARFISPELPPKIFIHNSQRLHLGRNYLSKISYYWMEPGQIGFSSELVLN